MRLSLVSGVALSLVTTSSALMAQGPRQLELSLLGGVTQTGRSARLSAEEVNQPYSGVRADARLAKLWGGRVGIAAQVDRYNARLDGLSSPPCMAVCQASSLRLRSSLIPVTIRSLDERLLVGASWQRPLASWLNAELRGLFGVRRLESVTKVDGAPLGESFPLVQKGVVGAQAGVSAQWHGIIGGATYEYASGSQWQGVRRAQNRVALRAGYALPLGGAK